MSTHNTFFRRNEKYSSISVCKCTLFGAMMNTEVWQINTQGLQLNVHFFTLFHSNLFSAFGGLIIFVIFLVNLWKITVAMTIKCKWRTDLTVILKKIENGLGVSRTLKTHACKKSMKTFRSLSRWCHLNVFQLNIYHCHGN